MTYEHDLFRVMVEAMLCRVMTTKGGFGPVERVEERQERDRA